MKKLNDVREYLSEIPNINLGGCGIAALTMLRVLKKNNIQARIIFLHESDEIEQFSTNKLALEDNDIDPIACSHIGVKVGNRAFDCNEDLKLKNWERIETEDEKYLLRMINNPRWNKKFDRENVKKIEEHTGVCLSDVKIF